MKAMKLPTFFVGVFFAMSFISPFIFPSAASSFDTDHNHVHIEHVQRSQFGADDASSRQQQQQQQQQSATSTSTSVSATIPNLFGSNTSNLSTSSSSSSSMSSSAWNMQNIMRITTVVFTVYSIILIILITSSRAQSYLIFLHIIHPPQFLFPLTDLIRYRLSNHARNIRTHNLRGWHILPPGPPYPTTTKTASTDGGADVEEDKDRYYERRLRAPNQRVIIFFHGNAGNRSFPPKRVHVVKLLNSSFKSHIITFDYSGFGDSTPGAPSAQQFYNDAQHALSYVTDQLDSTSSLFIYGQSLGTFAAMSLTSNTTTTTTSTSRILTATPMPTPTPVGVILDAPPASVYHAAFTHPVMKPFRVFGISKIFHRIIKEANDMSNLKAAVKCKLPLLVLHGKIDKMIPVEQGQMIADVCEQNGNEDVTFVSFEDVGHVDVSGADLYLQTVWDFITRLEKLSHVGPLYHRQRHNHSHTHLAEASATTSKT